MRQALARPEQANSLPYFGFNDGGLTVLCYEHCGSDSLYWVFSPEGMCYAWDMTFPEAFALFRERRSSERESGWLIVGVEVIGANSDTDCTYRKLMRMAFRTNDASLRISSAEDSSREAK